MVLDDDVSCEQIRKRVRELDVLTEELLSEQREKSSLESSWSGNLGHWYWNVQTNTVVFDPLKIRALGYERSEVPDEIPYQFFTDLLHPQDYEPIMEQMRSHLRGDLPAYEVEYRIKAKDGSWKWFFDRGMIVRRTEEGAPLLLSGIVYDITAAKEREMELERQNHNLQIEAWTDPLTGIANRRAALRDLERVMELSALNKQPLYLCMLDIDHFKQVNDTQGHVYGDQVLKIIAGLLRDAVRGHDIAGRYGGEEFIAAFYGADEHQAQAIAERVRRQVQEYQFDRNVRVTISGGLQRYGYQSMTELISDADSKLYEAKAAGRNRIIS